MNNNYNVYYNWACLLSLAGKYDESFEKLKIAWDKGFKNVKQIKREGRILARPSFPSKKFNYLKSTS